MMNAQLRIGCYHRRGFKSCGGLQKIGYGSRARDMRYVVTVKLPVDRLISLVVFGCCSAVKCLPVMAR